MYQWYSQIKEESAMDTITHNGKIYIPLTEYLSLLNSSLDAKIECEKLRNPFYKVSEEKLKKEQQPGCKVYFLERSSKKAQK